MGRARPSISRRTAAGALFVFAALGAAGCAPIRVSTDYDPTASFSDLRAYAPQERERRVNEAVAAILEHFPPLTR